MPDKQEKEYYVVQFREKTRGDRDFPMLNYITGCPT